MEKLTSPINELEKNLSQHVIKLQELNKKLKREAHDLEQAGHVLEAKKYLAKCEEIESQLAEMQYGSLTM